MILAFLLMAPWLGNAQPWLNANTEAQSVFDPTKVLEITLTMDRKDWDTIRFD